MFYDQTDVGPWYRPGLSHSWWLGGHMYRGLRRLDDWRGFERWDAALDWLVERSAGTNIAEVQYWGHGKWGELKMNGISFDAGALDPGAPGSARLDVLAERMTGPEATWWFRTCETFGGDAGHDFARRWTERFGCRAAGHTYIIGPYQSGLHSLSPGRKPHWSASEGIVEGSAAMPRRAAWSTRHAPNTISFLHGRIPADY